MTVWLTICRQFSNENGREAAGDLLPVYPIFASFLVTFVQNIRGIVDYSKNEMSG